MPKASAAAAPPKPSKKQYEAPAIKAEPPPAAELAAVWVHPKTLKPWAKNPRKNDGEPVNKVAESIKRFGFAAPIVARTATREIIAGHTRWKAAAKLNLDRVPVRFLDISEREAHLLALADNRLGELAEWDDSVLHEILAGYDVADILMAGWDEKAMRVLERAAKGESEIVEDDVPEPPKNPVTKPGDLWVLGKHRLVCGDSTNAKVADLSTGGATAACVFTDPPYGMSYKGTHFGKGGLDNDTDHEWETVLSGAARQAQRIAPAAVHSYCFGAARLDRYFACLSALRFHRLLTIYKPNRVAKPWRGWVMTTEHIGLFSVGEPTWVSDRHCHDVYTHDYSERPDKTVDHPTVKPLSVVADVVRKTSLSGTRVYDPFCGSGTTLIAAEHLERVCVAVELSPAYCDVIVERWQKLTGGKAQRNP